MQLHASLAARNRHSGFSLIELAICIMLMGIIMVASVRILDRVEDAKVKSAAQTARRINEIASIVYETTGAWPSNTKEGRLPPELEPYLSNNIIGNTTPLGGIWQWNGPSGSISESAGIAIRFESDSDVKTGLLSQLDRLIDNGDLSSGACWITSDSGTYCYVMAADATQATTLEVTPTPRRFVSPVRAGIQEAKITEEAIFSPSLAEPVRPEVPSAL